MKKTREEKYLELMETSSASYDEFPASSLEQPSPLEIIPTSSSSETDIQEITDHAKLERCS